MNDCSKIKDPLISCRGIAMFCCFPDMFHGCDSRAHTAEWFCWGLESSCSHGAAAQHHWCTASTKDRPQEVAAAETQGCWHTVRVSYFTALEKRVLTHLNSSSRIYWLCQETENFTFKALSRSTCSTYVMDYLLILVFCNPQIYAI